VKIISKEVSDVIVLDLDGNIKSSDDLEVFTSSIDEAIASGKKKVLLNFEGVNFINSSGLGRLIMAIRKMGEVQASLKVSNLGSDLGELFSFTKLSEKVSIHDTEEEALTDFNAS